MSKEQAWRKSLWESLDEIDGGRGRSLSLVSRLELVQDELNSREEWQRKHNRKRYAVLLSKMDHSELEALKDLLEELKGSLNKAYFSEGINS